MATLPIDDLVADLLARLPELDWHLSKLSPALSSKTSLRHVLPKGLFNVSYHAKTKDYIADIKQDIEALIVRNNQSPNDRVTHYMAKLIGRKINALVTVCTQFISAKSTDPNQGLRITGMDQFHKRLISLETLIDNLTEQKKAFCYAIDKSLERENSAVHLNLLRELGELEKRLTRVRETYEQTIGQR